MIRTYDEMQQVLRRIEDIVHKYVPAAEIKIVPFTTYYAQTIIPYDWGFRRSDGTIIIELAQNLIESGTWEEIEDVIAHEIAHVLDSERFNITTRHGEDWRTIARALGSSAKSWGDVYPHLRYPKRYKFRCADCGYTFVSGWKDPGSNAEPHEHYKMTGRGHEKWFVYDELTGQRWAKKL
jgi:hypothetical protein